jgi:hypothetical protein
MSTTLNQRRHVMDGCDDPSFHRSDDSRFHGLKPLCPTVASVHPSGQSGLQKQLSGG